MKLDKYVVLCQYGGGYCYIFAQADSLEKAEETKNQFFKNYKPKRGAKPHLHIYKSADTSEKTKEQL